MKHLYQVAVLVILFLTICLNLTKRADTQVSQKWVANARGLYNSNDKLDDVARNMDGNVYITGYLWNDETNGGGATGKADLNGEELWMTHYNGPGSFNGYKITGTDHEGGKVHRPGYNEDSEIVDRGRGGAFSSEFTSKISTGVNYNNQIQFCVTRTMDSYSLRSREW